MAELPVPQISEIENTQPQIAVPHEAEGHEPSPSDEDLRGIFHKYKDLPRVQELVGLALWLRNGFVEDSPDNNFVANLNIIGSRNDEHQRLSLMTDEETEVLDKYDFETVKMISQQVVAKFKEEMPWIQRLIVAESAVPNDASVVDHPLLSAQKLGVTDHVLTSHGLTPEEIDDRTNNVATLARRAMQVRHTNLDENPPLKKDEYDVEGDIRMKNMQLRAELMLPLVWETLWRSQGRSAPEFTELLATTTIDNGELIPAWDLILIKDRSIIDRISGRHINFRFDSSDSLLEQHKKDWCRDLGKGLPADSIFRFSLFASKWEMLRAQLYLAGIDERDFLRAKRSSLGMQDSANDSAVTHSIGKPEAGDDEVSQRREVGIIKEGSLPRSALLHFDSGVTATNLEPFVKSDVVPKHTASIDLQISIRKGQLQRLPRVMGMQITQVRAQDGVSVLTDDDRNFYIRPQEDISVASIAMDLAPDVRDPYDISGIQVEPENVIKLADELQGIGLDSMAKKISQIKDVQSLGSILAELEPYFVYGKKGDENQTREINDFSDIASFVKKGKVYGVCSLYANLAEQIVRVLLPEVNTSFLHGFIADKKRIMTPSHVQLGIDVDGEQRIVDITPSRRVLSEKPKKWLTNVRRVMQGGSSRSQKPELAEDAQMTDSQIEPIKAVDVIAIPPPKSAQEKRVENVNNNITNLRQLLVRRFNLPDSIVENDANGLVMKGLAKQSKENFGRQAYVLLTSADSAQTAEQIETNQVAIRKQRETLQQWKDADLTMKSRLQKNFGNWSEREINLLDEMLASLEN